MVDAINHRTRAATLIEYDGAARRFALRADGPTAAGEECFVSYGPLDNDELLLRYGFVEAENPGRRVVPVRAPPPRDLFGGERRAEPSQVEGGCGFASFNGGVICV